MIHKILHSGLHSALVLFTCLGGTIISLPAIAPESLPISRNNHNQVEKIAKSITVKILSQDFLGTGILIQKQVNPETNPETNTYTVITNNHVIDFVETPYQIQTPDGIIYNAQRIKNDNFKNYDLGLLKFTSNQNYPLAKIGKSTKSTISDQVFVGGFVGKQQEMIFSQGKLSLILKKPLEGGYQIGYTNEIQKGMSGGAVLNCQGEVIGINGLHKNPLWEAPDFYFDGSKPEQPLQEKITRSSWGIPIETVILILSETGFPGF